MQKIVYLIGAGASAGANFKEHNSEIIKMPLAHNFHIAIQQFCLNDNFIFKGANDPELNQILKDISEFAGFIEKFNTIDEAMRKLYLKNDQQLFDRYKQLISIVFYILECMHKNKDTRYEQFLLTIVDSNYTLPKNVNILSWNYDNQFELAASNIKDGEKNGKSLVKKVNYYKINGTSYDFDLNVSWHSESKLDWQNPNGIICNYHVHREYIHKLNTDKSSIEFAWEEPTEKYDSMEGKLVENLKLFKGDREPIVLVAIGYSFPYVNSIYDGKIFEILKPFKVFIQDPFIEESAINDIKDRFELDSDQIRQIRNSNRFYLPVELYKRSQVE